MFFGIFLTVVFGWLSVWIMSVIKEHPPTETSDKILLGGLLSFTITMIMAGILTIIGSLMERVL